MSLDVTQNVANKYSRTLQKTHDGCVYEKRERERANCYIHGSL
jgi:hypothetical protein